jgi:hypothetical protein
MANGIAHGEFAIEIVFKTVLGVGKKHKIAIA